MLYAAYRAAFYAAVPNACARLFGLQNIGRSTGLLFTLTSPSVFLLYPVVWWAERGHWTAVNVTNCLLVLPMVGFVAGLGARAAQPRGGPSPPTPTRRPD